jgi:hypothetical protein
MRNILASALLFLAGCASTSADRPADIAQPEIRVRQAGPIFLSQGTTPVSIDVEITNRANAPLVIREVEIASPDSAQYSIARARRLINETVAPGETKKVTVTSTAVAENLGVPVGEPLSVRAFVRFEANGKSFREVAIGQLSPLS